MMQRLYLIMREAFSARVISLVVFCTVTLAVFAIGIFGIVGGALNDYIERRFATAIPPNTIKISPPPGRTAFLFQVRDERAPVITDGTLSRIRGLDGVTHVDPVAALDIPLQARINFMGMSYRSDILALGVPARLVAGDIAGAANKRLWNDRGPLETIPVLVPRAILQAYNDGMAGANALPRLSEQGAVGIGFRLQVGSSSLRRLEGAREYPGVIAGFTGSVNLFALIIPLHRALALNRQYLEGYRPNYIHAYVRVHDHAALLRVTPQIRKLGLVVEAEKTVAAQIQNLRETVTLVIAALRSLVLFMAVTALGFATVIATLNRLEYYRILRILGASKLFIAVTIALKYLAIGGAGTALGLYLVGLLAAQLAGLFHLSGIVLTVAFTGDAWRGVALYGTLIPLLATLPAMVRLFTKGLTMD